MPCTMPTISARSGGGFVKVLVWVSRMWTAGDMTVGVEVGFLTVAVHMIVHALAPQTQQYVDTENDQHQADRGFEQQCQMGPIAPPSSKTLPTPAG